MLHSWMSNSCTVHFNQILSKQVQRYGRLTPVSGFDISPPTLSVTPAIRGVPLALPSIRDFGPSCVPRGSSSGGNYFSLLPKHGHSCQFSLIPFSCSALELWWANLHSVHEGAAVRVMVQGKAGHNLQDQSPAPLPADPGPLFP